MASTRVRYPFMDIDGLEFEVGADGHVVYCRYSIGSRELANVPCDQTSR